MAAVYIGNMYRLGQGVEQDYAKAVDYFRQCDTIPAGQYFLGLVHATGQGVEQNHELAHDYFQQAADAKYASALYDLGQMYRFGRGVPQDYQKALEFYQQAAEQECWLGLISEGEMHHYGEGVEQNYSKAIALYQEALSKGCDRVLVNIGILYKDGWDTCPPDYSKAINFLGQAAEQGNFEAIEPLKAILEDIQGVLLEEKKAGKYPEQKDGLENYLEMMIGECQKAEQTGIIDTEAVAQLQTFFVNRIIYR